MIAVVFIEAPRRRVLFPVVADADTPTGRSAPARRGILPLAAGSRSEFVRVGSVRWLPDGRLEVEILESHRTALVLAP